MVAGDPDGEVVVKGKVARQGIELGQVRGPADDPEHATIREGSAGDTQIDPTSVAVA